MKEFFLILFFAKVIALTGEPIDIVDRVSFDLKEPVTAITSGAHIRIDVTSNLPDGIDPTSIVSVLEALDMQYPGGSVTAVLTTQNGDKTILNNVSGSTDGKKAELLLSSSSGVSTGIEFSRLEIKTAKRLVAVSISWQNYSE